MEAVSIRIIQIGLHMLFPSIVLEPRPSTGTQHKSLGWLGIGPGPKSVDATWPVRAMDDITVHEHSTLPNRLGYA
jgi:hypothetical protein